MIHTVGPDEKLLYTRLHHYGALRIRQFIPREEALGLAADLRAAFDPALDKVAGTARPDAPLQKVVDDPWCFLPRYVRMLYETHPLRSVFHRLITLRNYCAGLPPYFASEGPQSGWWTATRFNHYPVGGGFMAEHRDDAVLKGAPGLWAQPVLLLTERGQDYAQGGGTVNGADYEWDSRAGDCIVYTGSVLHGVAPVDPARPREATLAGRLVAMVTLYPVPGLA